MREVSRIEEDALSSLLHPAAKVDTKKIIVD